MSKIATLLRKDARGIWRDGFLLFMSTYALVLALVGRVAVGWIPIQNMDLYLAPVFVILGGFLLGTILGFALIEEREHRTWQLLRVLPLPETTLFAYLTATACSFALLSGLACAWLYGRNPVDVPWFLAMTVVSALVAPLVMLTLGVAASNKIEGFALAKILGFVVPLPGLIFLISAPWQLLLVWNPWYWIYLGLLRAYAGEAGVSTLPLHWPGYPSWMFVVFPVLLSGTGAAILARIYRRWVQ